ncbi:surface protein [Bifidobacterium longum subsp. longum]|uniref:Surface protein n=1 Tax=Bifidobacterium longum subsp. longum TaxID=1679 RepID=A0A4R0VIK8_BIFLL|nr:InlB B-repeat-containing protein [Bifidobacterium longum]TCF63852.1 surface protein [Bifidobacterium longum subsp. longum]
MRTWLKRMVAGIVSAGTLMGGGLLMAGTANADEIRMPDIGKTITSLTASAATTYPRELVNGDFEYPSMKSLQHYFTGIDRNRSQWISNGQGDDLAKWSDIPGGLDTTRFGWSSTQTQGAMSEQRANAVELQKATGETTQMGELCASQKDTAIYQDIATTPGTLYRIELDHTSRYRIHLDQMQVMVGAPGHEQPVEMTRTSSNKYGDKIGEKSTTIATHSTNPFGNQSSKDDFSHYVGYYTIPAGQSVTRFTFRQVSGVNTTSGNLLDNIVFTKAYKLDYDKNSDEATGQTPNDTATVKPAKTSATGGVKNVADTNASLPDHLVNGDFEYLPDGGWKTVDAPSYMTNAYTSVDPNNGQYMRNAKHSDADLASWVDWPGFDQSKFAWKTDQKGGHDQGGLKDRAEAVELQQDSMDGNTYAEMVASEPGRTIYQNLATIPGTLYKIRLKHTSLCKDNVDQMQVVINGTPIEMTRVAANGKAGDKVGEKSKTIGTRVTNENRWHHSDQWETYEGYYVIPDGQTTTRFGFKAVNYLDPTKGNLLDDVTFARAYKLSYDANGGAKKSTSQIKASTDGKVKTIAGKTDSLPTELVNGSFDYPAGLIAGVSTKYPWDDWTVVDPINGRYARHIGIDKDPWAPIPGWDASKFAWKSTQTKGTDWQQIAQGVELQKDSKTGNQYAELVAGQAGTAIYQDIATIPGVSYRWTLKHASLDRNHLDGMSVMIGEPGKESAQDARRTTVNGNGDQPGDVGKVISTKVSNDAESNHESNHSSRNHDGQWETYTGTYIATGTVTRFTFKSVSSSNNVNGNILDDLSFTKAYRLGYDGNGGTGQVPSRTEVGRTETAASGTDGTVRLAADKSAGPESGTIADDRRVLTDTTARQDDGTSQRTITRSDGSVRVETIADTGAVSGCQVYYPAGTRITLATAKADSDCWDSSQIGKTNRTFYGWSANTDANDRDVPVGDTMDRNTLNANVRTEIVMPARAKTVYALWAINPTLSYNVNTPAGSNAPGTPASQTVPYNTAAADKSGWAAGDTGKIPGYRFDGWYTAPNGGNKYDFNTPLTGNVTVYAHWVGNGYTVRFAGNGATGGGTPDQAFQYNIGQNLHRNGFVRDGYTFTGWKRADNQQAYGDGQWVTNLTTQPNGIVTMVAQWSANEAHIRYNPNPPAGKTAGGNGTPNWDGHTGDTPTIGGNGWTIDGYTFAGWATSPDGGGTKYAPGASWTANGTLTLYAQWTPGQASLTYDGNGATGGKTDPQTGKTDEKINVRDNGFTRDGYTFVTWNTQADCKGNAVKPNSEWTLRGSSTLYACWAGNAQTLTYHGNGATGGNTAAQSGKTGDELTTNANGFTRDGYTFVRWDTAKDGSGTAYGEGKNGVSQYVMKPAGNDLYAIWKANPATIQYRNDWPNTTGSTPDTTGNTGDTVTISQNSFDRPGYTFTGWSTSKRGDPSLQPGDKHTLEPRTTTVWAQWKADPAHLVYNSNIGTVGSETKTVDGVVDQTVKTITNPFDRPGYTFSGWNTQADGKGKAYATGADYVLTANDKSTPKNTSVLYAQWKINGASLKFNPNGGIGHVDDVTGDAFSTVTIPGDAKEPKITRPGYRFVG